MKISFEKLVSRSIGVTLARKLELAGSKTSLEKLLTIMIIGGLVLLIGVSFSVLIILHYNSGLSALAGIAATIMFEAVVYAYLAYGIDSRKTKLQSMLPDYFQITSANLRSGISLDRAMLLAARPEFGFFSDDIKNMSRKVFGGETLDEALQELSSMYTSETFKHAIRMILEAQRYGGAMADLLEQLSKDIRMELLVQKEIAGQLFMYSIFIAFVGLIAAPVLYALTSQMIVVTNKVWNGILASNPGGLPTTGISFLRPSPPHITSNTYDIFAIIAVMIITGFASLIMSSISSGSTVKGMRLLPVFIIIGIAIFFVVGNSIATVFSSIA